MKIAITHTDPGNDNLSATIETETDNLEFAAVVTLFRKASLGVGFSPQTIDDYFEPIDYPERPAQKTEAA